MSYYRNLDLCVSLNWARVLPVVSAARQRE
jgi:hypothetical protein